MAGYVALNPVGAATPWKLSQTPPVGRFKAGLKLLADIGDHSNPEISNPAASKAA